MIPSNSFPKYCLRNWCGEDIIEPLLRHIQNVGQTADFDEYLISNFGEVEPEDDERPDWQRHGF